MHLIVSWDISSEGSRRQEINTAMKEQLIGYTWIHPLTTFYILNVDYEGQWEAVRNKLYSVAEHYSGEVNFLMSPLYEQESDFFIYTIPDNDFCQNT
jgi:hypothetical protein